MKLFGSEYNLVHLLHGKKCNVNTGHSLTQLCIGSDHRRRHPKPLRRFETCCSAQLTLFVLPRDELLEEDCVLL